MRFFVVALVYLTWVTVGCSSSVAPVAPSATAETPPLESPSATPAPLFHLEPSVTTIGVGQVFTAHAALKSSTSAPYPDYLDGTTVTWTSSNPSAVSVTAEGTVTARSQGAATITGTYQGHTSEIKVTVSGVMMKRNVSVTGQTGRSYSIYLPPATSAAARPLLLSFHGGGGTAMIQAQTTQLNTFAHERGFIVAYGEGTGAIQTYNAGACCGSAQTRGVDDVAYVRAVLDDIEATFNVETAKIYSTGFSNGGMLSHRLACELSDRIAGVAPIGGASGQFDADGVQYYACNPARPIPVLHIHAANDRNYPYSGGYGDGFSATPFRSVPGSIEDWIQRNNVTNVATVETVTTTTTCYRYSARADATKPSAPVALCVVDPVDVYDPVTTIVHGGGHSWPGGTRSPSPSSDSPVSDFRGNAYMWQFFGN